MNDELKECYDLLGLNPSASPEELKVAYRDLAKVWHPDRFLHDPRLQEKAQEKLNEINEAYDQLRSGKAKRQAQRDDSTNPRRSPPPPGPFDEYARTYPQTGTVAVGQRIRWPLILAPVLIFAAVFWATYRSLLRPNEQEVQSQASALEQADAPSNPDSPTPGGRGNTKNELLNGTDRTKAKSQGEEPDGASTNEASAAPARQMSTVTVVIDPYTGMIAGPDCPLKSKMTYPSGSEPHQQCTALHPRKKTAPADVPVPKDSRIKSVAKRLASPGKWFGDGAKPDAGNKQEPNAP